MLCKKSNSVVVWADTYEHKNYNKKKEDKTMVSCCEHKTQQCWAAYGGLGTEHANDRTSTYNSNVGGGSATIYLSTKLTLFYISWIQYLLCALIDYKLVLLI